MTLKSLLPCSRKPQTAPYPEPHEYNQHPQKLRCMLISSFHLHLGLPSDSSFSGFPAKILYATIIYPVQAIWPVHLMPINLITLIIFGDEYRSWSSSLLKLFQHSATLSLSDPNTFLSTLFTITLNQCSSLNVDDQVSQSYKYRQIDYKVSTYLSLYSLKCIKTEMNEKVLNSI